MAKRPLHRFTDGLVRGFDDLILGRNIQATDKIRDGINETLYLDAGEDSLDRVDAKAGSVLTHISMMIAAATFVVSSDETHWLEQVFIGIEITVYIFLALCCLRCLLFHDLPAKVHTINSSDLKSLVRDQAIRHGLMLNFAIRWTFLISFVFALSLFRLMPSKAGQRPYLPHGEGATLN